MTTAPLPTTVATAVTSTWAFCALDLDYGPGWIAALGCCVPAIRDAAHRHGSPHALFTGEGALAEFPTAGAALAWAHEARELIRTRRTSLPAGWPRAPRARFALHREPLKTAAALRLARAMTMFGREDELLVCDGVTDLPAERRGLARRRWVYALV